MFEGTVRGGWGGTPSLCCRATTHMACVWSLVMHYHARPWHCQVTAHDSVHSMCLAGMHANSILDHANALQGTSGATFVANAAVPQLARCYVRQATAGSGCAVLGRSRLFIDSVNSVNSGTVTKRTNGLRHCYCGELIVQCQAGMYCCGVVVRAQAGCMLACLHSSVLSASATSEPCRLAEWLPLGERARQNVWLVPPWTMRLGSCALALCRHRNTFN